ncbi:unnamed protein product [Diatraea saccharalis]|uniref:Uncharacterized protein n=1 Tax=Diatraea saccharalis TaxID=40085 RepID=A0A9N9R5I9_9NEOP|nr:unnamed protein product [Diatraea saccharalis]
MLETYREFRDKKSGRSLFVPASMWELSPIHYIIAMEQVHALETDIDKLIHSLERIDSEDFNPDPRYIETTTLRRRPVRPRAMEMERNIKENFREEEETLKRRYREEQLLRRVGASGRHTKRPRFQQQWPVEETWRLGPYGDGAKYY